MLNLNGDPMWKPLEPAAARKNLVVAVKLTVLNWRFGGFHVSMDVRPRLFKVKPASKVGKVANVLGKPAPQPKRSAPTPTDV